MSGPTLVCPVDAVALVRTATSQGSAVWGCGLHEYPEVDDIPVLVGGADAATALAACRRGDAAAARAALLTPDRGGAAETGARLLSRLLRSPALLAAQRARRVRAHRRRHGDVPPPSFREALGMLLLTPPDPQPESVGYFFCRPSDPTFAVAEAVTSATPDGDVLDLCCGAGHVTRLLATAPGRHVVGLDASYGLLFLARTYLAPRARFVCARADRPLPFAATSFDAVVCSDALHDTEDPAVLAREAMRVLRPGGACLAVHLHHARARHHYRGRTPLLPEGYAALFDGGDPRLLDEGPILREWVETGSADLRASEPPARLDGARTLTLLAGGRHVDRVVRAAPPRLDELAVSPLYRAEPRQGGLHLTRAWPSDAWRREYPDAEDVLPAEAHLGADALTSLRAARGSADLERLVRRRVLVELPARYGAARPW